MREYDNLSYPTSIRILFIDLGPKLFTIFQYLFHLDLKEISKLCLNSRIREEDGRIPGAKTGPHRRRGCQTWVNSLFYLIEANESKISDNQASDSVFL